MFENITLFVWIFGPLVGFVGMTAGGFWGVGCGWLVVPSMLLMGLSPSEAVGISLLQMVPSIVPTVIRTTPAIGWAPGGLGRRIVLPMAAGAFLTSFTGKFVNAWMENRFGASGLMILFTCVMVVIGSQTLFSRSHEYGKSLPVFSGKQSLAAFAGGLGTGVFSSVLGVGGALFMRPVLASGFRIPEKETACSIRLMLLVTTLTGGLIYVFSNGGISYRILILSLLISLGGMVGFPLGVKIHRIASGAGYVQLIHKSFSVISGIVITSTLLKLFGFNTFSRYLMLVFAAVLLTLLLCFARYAEKHPVEKK